MRFYKGTDRYVIAVTAREEVGSCFDCVGFGIFLTVERHHMMGWDFGQHLMIQQEEEGGCVRGSPPMHLVLSVIPQRLGNIF